MSAPLGGLSIKAFLTEHWQKTPCLIRQAFPGFRPELTMDDVAGLACEEFAESRLISGSYPAHDWSLQHGPFTERSLRRLPESNWTLLVQDVEKHYPPLQTLLAKFDFLPGWRLDDLMISVAAPGGSVGPHCDQYDVFLLQADGRRRWQVAASFDPTLQGNPELNVLRSFAPEQEWELQPGDMLYVPPGVAHHGVALDGGMTWSIGLRAPSQAELLVALGEWLAEKAGEGERYTDGLLDAPQRPGEISTSALEDLRNLMARPMSVAGETDGFLSGFLTHYRLAHPPVAPAKQLDETVLAQLLTKGATLQRNPWTRLAWIERDGRARLFASGDEYACSVDLARQVCSTPMQLPPALAKDIACLRLVGQLLNGGHLLLEEPPPR
ncbi:MAG: JmjC domain-containing protein [Lysobacterales bacterium]